MKWPKTFDLDKSEPQAEAATPDNTPTIANMAGSPLDEVKREATQVATPTQVISPGPKGQSARRQIAKERQEQEDREREASIEVIGKVSTRKLAALPYRVWAYLASDPSLNLTAEEQKELADAYFQLVKAMKPNMNKPAWILGTIVLLNFDIVSARITKKLEQTEEGRKILQAFADEEPRTKQ